MARASVRERFDRWRHLMTVVKLEVAQLDPQAADFVKRQRTITCALQLLDTTAGDIIDDTLARLKLSTAKLEEAAVLLSARAAGRALAETPMVFASESEIGEIITDAQRHQAEVGDQFEPAPFVQAEVYQPETDRGYLQDMARPSGNVLLFTGVRRSRHDQGSAR